jgi:hypothetical protein
MAPTYDSCEYFISNELENAPMQATHAGNILGLVAKPRSNACCCVEHTGKLRTIFQPLVAAGPPNVDKQLGVWRALSDAMCYFMLVTDFFVEWMSDDMKETNRAKLIEHRFSGPKFSGHLPQ